MLESLNFKTSSLFRLRGDHLTDLTVNELNPADKKKVWSEGVVKGACQILITFEFVSKPSSAVAHFSCQVMLGVRNEFRLQ